MSWLAARSSFDSDKDEHPVAWLLQQTEVTGLMEAAHQWLNSMTTVVHPAAVQMPVTRFRHGFRIINNDNFNNSLNNN